MKSMLGGRDTLLVMFDVMRKLDVGTLLKCLKCLKLLTFDPALLQPLQVRLLTSSSGQRSWLLSLSVAYPPNGPQILHTLSRCTFYRCDLKCKLIMQDAGTIPVLLPYLGRRHSAAVQLEALHALYNLCKISRTRQEAAAVAGIVPYLAALAVPPAPSQVSLPRLPAMVASGQKTSIEARGVAAVK